DKVLLLKDTVLKSTTNGNVEFHDTVDSFDNTTHYFLTVNTGGNTVFGDGGADYVGQTFALSKLTTDAGGFTYLNITPSVDATPSVTTDSDQDYKDQVLLQQDTVLKATTGNITFEDTVNSATTAALKTLRLFADPTTGVIEFKKSVGTAAPIGTTANLPALVVTSGKELKFDATATDVKLSGALRIDVAGINVHGATPKTKIIGVRADQNVVEITKSSVTLQDLEITDDDATRTTGNGVVVASSPVGTTVAGTLLKNLTVHDHPDNGIVLTNVSGTQVTGSDIYDNSKDGVRIETSQGKTGNVLQTNTIHDNTLNGIYIATASDVLIGDPTSDALGNEIYKNTKNGVAIAADNANVNNRIQLNKFHDNTGLGIDLNDDGRTANDKADTATSDADNGANKLQNTPEILYSFKFQDPSDGLYKLAILYHVPSAISSGGPFTVNFYLADAGHQEGLTPLTTDTYSDAALKSKLFTLTISLADFNDPDKYVQGRTIFVATATDTAFNTSEFSLPAALNITPDAIINPNAARLDTQIDPNPAINDVDIDGNTHVDITQLTTAEAVNAAPAVRSNRTDYFGAVAPQDDTNVIWTITSQSDTTSLINVGGLYQIDNPSSLNDAPSGSVTNGGPTVSPSSNSPYAQKAIASKSSLDIAYSADPTLLGAYVVRATAGVSLSPDPLATNPQNELMKLVYQRNANQEITSIDSPTEAFFSFPAANPDAGQAVSRLQTGYDASGRPIIGNTPTPYTNMGAGAAFNHLGKIYLRLEDGALILPWEDNTKSSADPIRVTDTGNLRDNSPDGQLSFPGGDGTDHLVFGDFNDAVFTIANNALKPIGARAALTVSFPDLTPESNTGVSSSSLTVDPPAQDPVTVEDNSETDSNTGDDTDSGIIPVTGSGGSNSNGTGGTTINGTAGLDSAGGTSDSSGNGSDSPETGKKKKHERVKTPKTSHHKEHPLKVRESKDNKGN
ncbi:MAG: proteinputative collagen-binding proteinCalx-beta, partial [Planctomycetaceae bacterium]|nr:proteinputative collagen-binding proteinCalx-beta [Planctomycetaceae bacterium]